MSNLTSLMKSVASEENGKKFVLSSDSSKERHIAEEGFDPPTSGLWAQHASAAPLC